MSASTPLHLPAEDKLDLLRYLDEFHYWHSLDDKRHCKRCGRSITGRQILIIELQGTRGKLRLRCPTVACVSTPSDWVYADPVLAAKLRRDFQPVQRQSKSNADGVPTSAIIKLPPAPGSTSFRAVVARAGLLRTLATGLHAIHPIA
jgi:hypothetical protein